MGGSSMSSSEWRDYTQKTKVASATSAKQVYTNTSNSVKAELNPKNFEFRESRDNDAQPITTPIIIGTDITGSMEHLSLALSKTIGVFASAIFEKRIVQGPQICAMAIGDVLTDRRPIQITQFESDTKILDQLKEFNISENGGGGNNQESYHLPWFYASRYIKTDAWEKRRKKGIIITIGNDGPPSSLKSKHIREFFNKPDNTVYTEELLNEVSKKYEIYHINMMYDESYHKDWSNEKTKQWINLLGEDRVIAINDSDVESISDVLIGLCAKLNGATDTELNNLITNNNIKNALSVVKSSSDLTTGATEKTLVKF